VIRIEIFTSDLESDVPRLQDALTNNNPAELMNLFQGNIKFIFSNGLVMEENGGVASFYLSLIDAFRSCLLFGAGSHVIIDYESFIFCQPSMTGITFYHHDPAFVYENEVECADLAQIRTLLNSLNDKVLALMQPARPAIEHFVMQNPYSDLCFLLPTHSVRGNA